MIIPKSIADDPELRSIWAELEPQFAPRIGAAGLEAATYAMRQIREAEGRLRAEGLIAADGKGNPVPHPAIAIQERAVKALNSWITRFGRR